MQWGEVCPTNCERPRLWGTWILSLVFKKLKKEATKDPNPRLFALSISGPWSCPHPTHHYPPSPFSFRCQASHKTEHQTLESESRPWRWMQGCRNPPRKNDPETHPHIWQFA